MSIQLPDFSKTDILVVGDVMLDRYWAGKTERISPEAPVPIVHVNSIEERPGGAGNVARSITALGAHCTLAGLLGNDAYGKQVQQLLEKDKVLVECIQDANSETVTKLRVLSLNQQLIRLDFETNFSQQSISKLTDYVCDTVQKHDVMILSDYNKGALLNIERIVQQAKSNNVSIFVDPKGKDFSKYQSVTAITPNQSEFEDVVGDCETEQQIAEKGSNLINELNLDALVITRSERGVTLIEKTGEKIDIPARAKEVFDVTGAGDTFISVLASSYAAGCNFQEAVNIANAASSVVVGKLGAAVVTRAEIENELNGGSLERNKVFDQQSMLVQVQKLREQGKKIVMTNGCFDLLHNGHIACLRDAKSKGDYLIVAVNDDESIKRLKGETRPICNLQNRIAVLEELSCVDLVISFAEDTPKNLIEEIKPEVYVKGGDYKKEELPEYELVNNYGGEIIISPYIRGCSTTSIVDRILKS